MNHSKEGWELKQSINDGLSAYDLAIVKGYSGADQKFSYEDQRFNNYLRANENLFAYLMTKKVGDY